MDTHYEDPRSFLSRHKLKPKDSFGQCFLIAMPVTESIVMALELSPEDTVVEIGTGCGTLAKMIAPSVKVVKAIERDRDLVAALRSETLPSNIEILEQDATTFDYQTVQPPLCIVGNLPYQITGKLLRGILTPPVMFRCAVVMVQKEVAERMLAKPGDRDWGVLGIFTTAVCTVSKVRDVSPGCFYPAPKVTSSIVKLKPRATPLAEQTSTFSEVVHTLFTARRKTITNGLSGVSGIGKQNALQVCQTVGLDPMLRPESLTVEQLNAIAVEIVRIKTG